MTSILTNFNHALRACTFLSYVILLILLFNTPSYSQIGGIDSDPSDRGTGGQNMIQGNIYFPSGRRLDKRIRVRLSSIRGDFSTLTDDNGAFSFRRLVAGNYTITVDAGKEYEPATESIEMFDASRRRGREGQTITLHIQLKLRDTQMGVKPAVIGTELSSVPLPARELYLKALKSAQAGDNAKAIEQLKNAIDLYPQFTLAFNELGVQYMRLNQPDKSAAALRAALKLDPDAFGPHFNYGLLLLQQKKFSDAVAELELALKKNDASAPAHLYQGRALIGLHAYNDAEKELQKALKLGGSDVTIAHRFLGALYKERGENGRAADELETYLKLVPQARDAAAIRELIKQLREHPITTRL
jgi:tetratricopeptide (TPR) repeat protein